MLKKNHSTVGVCCINTMRVEYVNLTEDQFNDIFFPVNVRGNGLADISYYHPARGGNIFGVVGNILRRAIPIIKSLIVPELPSFAKSFSEDYTRNNNLRASLKSNLLRSGKNIGKRVLGGTRNRKNFLKKSVNKKKKPITKSRKTCTKKKNRRKKPADVNDIFNSGDFAF